jgi:hypothetical protein
VKTEAVRGWHYRGVGKGSRDKQLMRWHLRLGVLKGDSDSNPGLGGDAWVGRVRSFIGYMQMHCATWGDLLHGDKQQCGSRVYLKIFYSTMNTLWIVQCHIPTRIGTGGKRRARGIRENRENRENIKNRENIGRIGGRIEC